ncbi:hypothetical protein SAMN02745157_4986 [Kaistia soli DSM 19436]|uniref:Lysophospholipase L1 n=1 Tax=Kaistia soli DSM 19436 TaxID=1122133 RepID=A0A1M5NFQ0_9HYPH|nr:SGNH/GDSL hydrolase family protein [Kaistia soli]SHG88302.1 hypothetical protein SAMN02745157_4986 [Kaistia soli DSM 19436]
MSIRATTIAVTIALTSAGGFAAPAFGAAADPAAATAAKAECVWRVGDSLVASSIFKRQLMPRLPGWSDINDGLGSQTSTEVAGRVGARKVTVSVPGNELPGTGRPVPVTSIDPPILTSVVRPNSIKGKIGAIDVKLLWDGEAYSILPLVPLETDAPLTIPANAEFRPQPRPGRENCTVLIWMGRNNLGQTDTILADIASVVALARSGGQPFLIISVTNGEGEGTGTSGYAAAVRLNTALAKIYGDHFVDVRARLVAADPASNGTVTKTFRGVDRIHLNDAGNAIAAEAVADAILSGKAR